MKKKRRKKREAWIEKWFQSVIDRPVGFNFFKPLFNTVPTTASYQRCPLCFMLINSLCWHVMCWYAKLVLCVFLEQSPPLSNCFKKNCMELDITISCTDLDLFTSCTDFKWLLIARPLHHFTLNITNRFLSLLPSSPIIFLLLTPAAFFSVYTHPVFHRDVCGECPHRSKR